MSAVDAEELGDSLAWFLFGIAMSGIEPSSSGMLGMRCNTQLYVSDTLLVCLVGVGTLGPILPLTLVHSVSFEALLPKNKKDWASCPLHFFN